MFIFSPISYPLSKVLDFILGHDEGITVYSRTEMLAMMNIQQEENDKHGSAAGNLYI